MYNLSYELSVTKLPLIILHENLEDDEGNECIVKTSNVDLKT